MLTLAVFLFAGSVLLAADSTAGNRARPWFGVHLMLNGGRDAAALTEQVPKLAALGVNVVILEVNYGFQFQSHAELGSGGGLSKQAARDVAAACRKAGIRPIPQFNCLGHQSWAGRTSVLLTKHPELDETPGQFPENKGIYCRSWCPLHPDVNKVIFALMDELIDAFGADAFHVGMDEVFLIGSEHCSRCKGRNAAELFAKAVSDYHGHLVQERKVEMLMWGDRLLDGKATGYGSWEGAVNGTHPAIDMIPKDIIICDWHYGKRSEYPSIPLFLEKGFRVWPGGWDKVDASEALMEDAQRHRGDRMLGHLCTIWGKVKIPELATFPPLLAAARRYAASLPVQEQ